MERYSQIASVQDVQSAGSPDARAHAVARGALQLVVTGMTGASMADVQKNGSGALATICSGTDAAALARKQAAVDAGALSVVVSGMRAHEADAGVQERGSCALGRVNQLGCQLSEQVQLNYPVNWSKLKYEDHL